MGTAAPRYTVVDDGLAIDAARDRLAELLARDPRRRIVRRAGAQVERQEIGIEPDADVDQLHRPGRPGRLNAA